MATDSDYEFTLRNQIRVIEIELLEECASPESVFPEEQ